MKPATIKTTERIFKVTNFDGDVFLCNLESFSFAGELLANGQPVKSVQHLWNFNFERIDKRQVRTMLEAQSH